MRHVLLVLLALILFVPTPAAAQHHLHYGTIPELCGAPTVQAARDGRWSSPDTWSPSRVPSAGDRVAIPHGRTVTVDTESSTALECVGIHGRLNFAPSASSRLTVGTVIVHPEGHLWMGDAGSPIDGSAEIVIANRPTDAGNDPEQWGTSLLVLGRFDAYGSPRTAFVRVAAEPHAGDTTLALSQPVSGWRPGDRIMLPDTRQIPSHQWFNPNYALQHEVRRITSVGPDGRSVTLDAPLTYSHAGARDADGTPTVLADGTRLLPHVGNLTRSIQIRSQDPAGTRGHVVLTDRAAVDVRGAAFRDLGRTRAAPLDSVKGGRGTNQIGRYPVHFHHLRGPDNPTNTGYQYVFAGNVVENAEKWPIAIHGTHYGLVEENVVYHGMGAGISLENGSETENLIRHNFVVDIIGTINPRASGPGEENGMTPGSGGECYWGAGFNNRFVENVASGCRNPNQQIVSGVGFKFITPAAIFTTRNPRFRGADMTDPSQTIEVQPQRQQLVEFRGNEVYGLAAVGFTAWQLGTDGYAVHETQGESLVKDLRVWHTYDGAVWNYPTVRMTIENLVYRIDATASQPTAVTSGDYRTAYLTVRGGSIHAGSAFENVIDPLGVITLERIEAVTMDAAFSLRTPATPGTGAQRPASGVTVVLRGNVVRPWPGRPLRVLELRHDTSRDRSDVNGKYDVFVFDHQGHSGENFRAYFDAQGNQALYGRQAPCGTKGAHEGVDAITCPMSGTPPSLPPAAPPPPPTPSVPDPPPHGAPPPPASGDDDHGDDGHCAGRHCPPGGGSGSHAQPRLTDASPPIASRTAGDFDGDGRADLALYDAAAGAWHVLTSLSSYTIATVITSGGIGGAPALADVDGDGRTDAVLYRLEDGVWNLVESAAGLATVRTVPLDEPGGIPVPADYDGDGRADLAIYRPSDGTWHVWPSAAGGATPLVYHLGDPASMPAPADFDGDGRVDLAVYRATSGTWHVLASTGGFAAGVDYAFGDGPGIPAPADYDGDGRADLVVYQPESGRWRVRTSQSAFATTIRRDWGQAGDVPVPADYDGDGRADIAVYRPATGEWLVLTSSSEFTSSGFAQHAAWAGAVPVRAAP